MKIKIGDKFRLEVADLSRGGAGVARTNDGQTIFVPYTITGDVVNVEIVEIKKRHNIAKIIDTIEASPDRQQPQCDVFTRCGGCQWQHIPYSLQWSTKLKGIHQALNSAGIKTKLDLQEFPADTIWHYRNRVQMRGKGEQLGFYAERSHQIVGITECAIARPEINQSLGDIRNQGRKFDNEYKVEIEVAKDGSVQSHWNSRHAAGGFRQVNDEQNSKLVNWVQQTLDSKQPIYDLYGGSANLSRELALKGTEVHCVDRSSPQNQPDQPSALHFHNEDVLPWLKQRITDLMYKRIPAPNSYWSAIIDPPRGGMGDDFVDIISRLEILKVNSIVLVGCKTDTWARDIAKLLQRAWKLQSVAAFDFFPHTPHIECTAFLSTTAN